MPAEARQKSRGDALKDEGNALHQQGKYREAYAKYSEAIKEDSKNAIYYANRAASSLALKEYLDAASDARKSTNIDPTYAKAWGRLGTARTALGNWDESIDAWKKAIGSLPANEVDRTATDKRMLVQFEEGLKKAEIRLEEAKKPYGTICSTTDIDSMPWQKALKVMERFGDNKNTSARIIYGAYRDFKQGVETMNLLKIDRARDGRCRWVGKPSALADLSNGLLRDLRVFHIDRQDWFKRYNSQVQFESEHYDGWSSGGAKIVKEEALKRLQRDGWTPTRKALAMTIRGWLMCGFFATTESRYQPAVEFHSRAMEILDWGSRIWHDVPRDDRGVIFERSFIRGARRALINAILQSLGFGVECPCSRDELAEMARDIIAEVEAHPPDLNSPIDPGFYLSFWVYPKADALGTLGWYHTHLGLEASDAESASLEFAQAAQYYTQAAVCLPKDEEKAGTYWRSALEGHWYNNQPCNVWLPLVHQLTSSEDEVSDLWRNSPFARSREESMITIMLFVTDLMNALTAGEYSQDDIIKPCQIKELDKFPAPNVVYL